MKSNPRQPNFVLHQQPLADAIFDDATDNHMWLTVPAYRCGSDDGREKSIACSQTGRRKGLEDRKGAIDFLYFLERYELNCSSASRISMFLIVAGRTSFGTLLVGRIIADLNLHGLGSNTAQFYT